jgi:LAGLIDADG endonuclease
LQFTYYNTLLFLLTKEPILKTSTFGPYCTCLRSLSAVKTNQDSMCVTGDSLLPIDENHKFFMAGFLEGEAGFSVSIQHTQRSKFGVQIRPSFSISQHVKGKNLILNFRNLFPGGSLYKSGKNVLEYRIESKSVLLQSVYPFYYDYVYPYSGKREIVAIHKEIVLAMENKVHYTKDGLIRLINLSYSIENRKGRLHTTLSETLERVETFEKPLD